jgi:heat shock protein HtpX
MSEMPEPLLVYNRINTNRRRTRQLLVAFAVAMLPFASGATVWLAMPVLFTIGLFVVGLAPGLADAMEPASLEQAVMVEAGLFGSALILVMIALVVATTLLIYRYSSAMVLRAAQARPVAREDELDLHRIVENLCIGAGLPKPRLHLIESSTPNAFATGRTSGQAELVVTRGLLTLLDRRELEGVVAHELSHIGNQDIRLNTTLAGLVGTLTLPLTMIMAVLRSHPIVAVLGIVVGLPLVSSVLLLGWFGLTELSEQVREATGQELPPILWWWGLHSLATPFYMVLIAPVVGRLLKRGVSREREFLADADAVALTRNPESLALALIKVGSAHGTPIKVGPATAHIYFVDPVPADGPWLAGWFRSHPPVGDRLELLSQMGSGIAPSAVQAAMRAGTASRPAAESARTAVAVKSGARVGRFTRHELHPALALSGVIVLMQLWRGLLGLADILLIVFAATIWYYWRRRGPSAKDKDRSAAAVETPSQVESALLAGEADLGRRFCLAEPMTVLYSKPDGWSPAVDQLPEGTAITLEARESGFVQVRTQGGSVGYLGRRTRLVPAVDC